MKWVKTISTNNSLKKDFIGLLRFHKNKWGWNSKKTKLSLANWLTLNKFFEIEGTCNNLWSLNVMWASLEDTKEEEPTLEILKPSPLLMKIWSGLSKWVNWLIFCDSPVTWKLAPKSGIQVEPSGPFPQEEEFVSIALGWLEVGTTALELGLIQVLEVLIEPVELGIGWSVVGSKKVSDSWG